MPRTATRAEERLQVLHPSWPPGGGVLPQVETESVFASIRSVTIDACLRFLLEVVAQRRQDFVAFSHERHVSELGALE